MSNEGNGCIAWETKTVGTGYWIEKIKRGKRNIQLVSISTSKAYLLGTQRSRAPNFFTACFPGGTTGAGCLQRFTRATPRNLKTSPADIRTTSHGVLRHEPRRTVPLLSPLMNIIDRPFLRLNGWVTAYNFLHRVAIHHLCPLSTCVFD